MTPTARRLSHTTLLMLWLLLAATPAFAQNTPDIPSTIRPFDSASTASGRSVAQGRQPVEQTPLERAEWALVRPTPMVTLHVRKFVGYVMLVPAGALFLLYIFRPRPHVIAGAFAWAAGSLMLLALSFDSGGGGGAPNTITAGRLGIGAWSVCALVFGPRCVLPAAGSAAPVIRARCSGRW